MSAHNEKESKVYTNSFEALALFAMFLRKFKNLPLQDFPSEPLRRFAFGVFQFQIFEHPLNRA
ncbi:hypothetical protein RQM65_00930 [Pricia sp. S334]|jgi:hypothetical protein|uniref:Uncharacterized protein n=1 Tax=Pricia mediterranea TaxID=3076079 RepID=A0ABU3L0H7_9FLAO|nr:hypothetical protein [Pricia sp. S334]MDT7827225.1 hypothetical protein [Pricia sp. S334]